MGRDMLNRAIAVVEVEPIDVDGEGRAVSDAASRVYAGKSTVHLPRRP